MSASDAPRHPHRIRRVSGKRWDNGAVKSITVKVPGHLLIPFGVEKWRIEDVKVSAVSTDATYFKSTAPLCHIDMSRANALRLFDIERVMPVDYPFETSAESDLRRIQGFLDNGCKMDSTSETKFLDLYFEYIESKIAPDDKRRQAVPPASNPDWGYEALLPLPQAHLYCRDPLSKTSRILLTRMFKVDFAFWTGRRLVAVEIDGKTHIGSPNHIVKDRLLQRANVQVIHIMNEELVEHGTRVIESLLPPEIVNWWDHPDETERHVPSYGPFPF